MTSTTEHEELRQHESDAEGGCCGRHHEQPAGSKRPEDDRQGEHTPTVAEHAHADHHGCGGHAHP